MGATENPAGWATDGALAIIKAAKLDVRQYSQIAKKSQVLDGASRHETADNFKLCYAGIALYGVVRTAEAADLLDQLGEVGA